VVGGSTQGEASKVAKAADPSADDDGHGRDGMRVKIEIGDAGELELVRDPRTTLDPLRVETLVRELLPIVRSGFGNDQFTPYQVALAAIDVPYGAFMYRASELVGFTSASVLEDLPARVLYLGAAAVAPHVQGRGHYQSLLLARFAIGAVAEATYFTTRTQSPIVCRTLKAFRPYPFTPGTEHYQAAARQIAQGLDGHGPRTTARPGGPSFDDETGVVHEAYDAALYSALPWSGDPDIDGYIDAHLSIDRGDALIVVGSLRSAELDELCRRKLGFGFEDLMTRVAPLVHAA
jgi:hypothetical protein